MGDKIKGAFQKTITFLNEVRVELGKVTWPTNTELKDSTVAVFVTVVFFSLFVWVFDLGLTQLITLVF